MKRIEYMMAVKAELKAAKQPTTLDKTDMEFIKFCGETDNSMGIAPEVCADAIIAYRHTGPRETTVQKVDKMIEAWDPAMDNKLEVKTQSDVTD